jgi:hypothetical protein
MLSQPLAAVTPASAFEMAGAHVGALDVLQRNRQRCRAPEKHGSSGAPAGQISDAGHQGANPFPQRRKNSSAFFNRLDGVFGALSL